VAGARARQAKRGGLNRDLHRQDLDGQTWHPEAEMLLRRAVITLQLTGRGWDRVRRVARTIADLESSDTIGTPHVAEALALRGMT
jgi:magnesium chelatase family protein